MIEYEDKLRAQINDWKVAWETEHELVKQLTKQRDDMKAELASYETVGAAASTVMQGLMNTVDRLKKYVKHGFECECDRNLSPPGERLSCSCGLKELLEAE